MVVVVVVAVVWSRSRGAAALFRSLASFAPAVLVPTLAAPVAGSAAKAWWHVVDIVVTLVDMVVVLVVVVVDVIVAVISDIVVMVAIVAVSSCCRRGRRGAGGGLRQVPVVVRVTGSESCQSTVPGAPSIV